MFRRRKLHDETERTSKRFEFDIKHLWWIIPLAGVFCLMILQILWPESRARLFYSFNNQSIGAMSKDFFAEKIQKEFIDAKIVFDLEGERQEVALADIGASVDGWTLMEQIFAYKLEEKLIPFSLLAVKEFDNIPLIFDDQALNNFVDKYISECEKRPKDATIRLSDNGSVMINRAEDGRKIDRVKFMNAIKMKTKISGRKIELVVEPEIIKAARIGDDYDQIKNKIEGILARSIEFSFEYKIYTANRQDIAPWLTLEEIDDEIKIVIDDENLQKYAASINHDLAIPASETVVNFVNGREQSRKTGENGRQISYNKLKADILNYLNSENVYPRITLKMEDVLPAEQKNYSYTFDQAGLQAKVNELGGRYNIRLSIKQLTGGGWEANHRERESTPSASTYKLYVALKLFDEMKKGNWSWDSPINNTDSRGCFYQMIIVSRNECAEEWIRSFGRTNLNNYLYSLGISNATTFTSYDATRTSALDLRNTVEGIYRGSLVGGDNRGVLMDHMGRQQWRYGIPTGSKGKVYDKVGFLWSYIHDTAIVEHPRGTYVVAIMTQNASYAAIAQITRELEAFMYP